MAAIGKATLPWLQSTLPDRHTRVGSKTVLKKVECTAGTYYSAQFGEGKPSIGNRAQCKGREGGIHSWHRLGGVSIVAVPAFPSVCR